MTPVLLASLFTVSGLFAAASITQSIRRHGASALALRAQLRICSEWREVRITTRTVGTFPDGGAVILRPAFKVRTRSPQPEHALPAAA